MNLSLNREVWRVIACWSKTCLPWTYVYLPARVFLDLINVDPEKSIWRFGEFIHLRHYTKLPDGNLLAFRPLTWDHEAIKDVYGYEEYDNYFSIREGEVVVDVGAHIGTFSVKAAQKVTNQGKVIAVEPEKENYSLLLNNKKINRLDNLIPINGALASYTGKSLLYSRPGHSGGFSIVEKHSSQCTEVSVIKLDDLANRLCLRQIDFLKIDAEGSELDVLNGGKEILQRSSTKIVIAAYHKSDNPQKIFDILKSLGYQTTCSEDKFIYAWK
jgi:FkbM family methyltransferase